MLSFAKCDRSFLGKSLTQLFQNIYKNGKSSFRDLYVIGRNSFNQSSDQPVFVKEESRFRELNPYYYNRLVEILYPIFQFNRKGFIIANTVQEANRLTNFLNRMIQGIQFEAYHSGISDYYRKNMLGRSKSMDSHYLVFVRRLGEKIDLSNFSSYIDLDFNASLRVMKMRIKKVLSVSPGQMSYDILLLTDYHHGQMTRSLLNLLNAVDGRRSEKHLESSMEIDGLGVLKSNNIVPLSRDELRELRVKLKKSISDFWDVNKRKLLLKKDWPSYEAAEAIVQKKGIKSADEFRQKRKMDSELQKIPRNPDRSYPENWVSWPHFFGTDRSIFDVLQEQKSDGILPYTFNVDLLSTAKDELSIGKEQVWTQ